MATPPSSPGHSTEASPSRVRIVLGDSAPRQAGANAEDDRVSRVTRNLFGTDPDESGAPWPSAATGRLIPTSDRSSSKFFDDFSSDDDESDGAMDDSLDGEPGSFSPDAHFFPRPDDDPFVRMQGAFLETSPFRTHRREPLALSAAAAAAASVSPPRASEGLSASPPSASAHAVPDGVKAVLSRLGKSPGRKPSRMPLSPERRELVNRARRDLKKVSPNRRATLARRIRDAVANHLPSDLQGNSAASHVAMRELMMQAPLSKAAMGVAHAAGGEALSPIVNIGHITSAETEHIGEEGDQKLVVKGYHLILPTKPGEVRKENLDASSVIRASNGVFAGTFSVTEEVEGTDQTVEKASTFFPSTFGSADEFIAWVQNSRVITSNPESATSSQPGRELRISRAAPYVVFETYNRGGQMMFHSAFPIFFYGDYAPNANFRILDRGNHSADPSLEKIIDAKEAKRIATNLITDFDLREPSTSPIKFSTVETNMDGDEVVIDLVVDIASGLNIPGVTNGVYVRFHRAAFNDIDPRVQGKIDFFMPV